MMTDASERHLNRSFNCITSFRLYIYKNKNNKAIIKAKLYYKVKAKIDYLDFGLKSTKIWNITHSLKSASEA